jgi:CheY-like chemotaxis protein
MGTGPLRQWPTRLLSRPYSEEVRIVYHDPEATVYAPKPRHEIAMLDMGEPCMDGQEVARRLRRRAGFAGRPLAALTVGDHEFARQISGKGGSDRHLLRPLDLPASEGALSSP